MEIEPIGKNRIVITHPGSAYEVFVCVDNYDDLNTSIMRRNIKTNETEKRAKLKEITPDNCRVSQDHDYTDR